MYLVTCPKCHVRVLPKVDGTCPSCQARILGKGKEAASNISYEKIQRTSPHVKNQVYHPGVWRINAKPKITTQKGKMTNNDRMKRGGIYLAVAVACILIRAILPQTNTLSTKAAVILVSLIGALAVTCLLVFFIGGVYYLITGLRRKNNAPLLDGWRSTKKILKPSGREIKNPADLVQRLGPGGMLAGVSGLVLLLLLLFPWFSWIESGVTIADSSGFSGHPQGVLTIWQVAPFIGYSLLFTGVVAIGIAVFKVIYRANLPTWACMLLMALGIISGGLILLNVVVPPTEVSGIVFTTVQSTPSVGAWLGFVVTLGTICGGILILRPRKKSIAETP